jgi:hypothetical protein
MDNPYAGTPGAEAWGNGLAYGFAGPNYTEGIPPGIAPRIPSSPEVVEAFNNGRLAGQQHAIDGFPLRSECMDATEEVPGAAEEIVTVADGVHVAAEFALKHFARGAAGAVSVLMEVSLMTTHYKSPEDVLPEMGEQFVGLLSDLGVGSMGIFCGVGVDNSAKGCQLRFTRLFKSIDQARDAVKRMGRSQWVMARWRTDQCGGLTLVESNES